MVKFIEARETLPLRSIVLRDNIAEALCVFPTDEVPGAFHLGFFEQERLVCVASFFPDNHPGEVTSTSRLEEGEGYRLRGMATDPQFAGKGFGAALVNFAKEHLKNLQASYLWCNARSSAEGFYSKLGFDIVSAEFEIVPIGPHYEMLARLDKINQ
jgi:GNAT superfamily N-acetyltransferase